MARTATGPLVSSCILLTARLHVDLLRIAAMVCRS